MAITPTEFRAAFPEFRNAPDTLIQPKLDQAYRRCGDSWGTLRDDGAMWLAAHLVAISPLSEPSSQSVKAAAGRTTYLDEWDRLLKQVRVWGTAVSSIPIAPGVGD